MRRAFLATLVELAAADESVVLLTGDLGYTVLEPFAERFPDRFFNVGVAEQNMLGLATGLAACGFTPFAYSIATFASMRAYEFLRNGAVLHGLPVRLVGVGGGLDYGHNGPTHHALEDIGIMRVQPDLAVIAPADADQTRTMVRALADVPGPAYLRVGKDTSPVPALAGRFRIGRAETIGDGRDVALVTYGNTTGTAVEAARLLAEQGVSATVVVTACLSPAPVDDLADVLGRVPLAVALESHFTGGGVGSLACEVVAEQGLACRVVRRGLTTMPRGTAGDPEFLADRHGLTAAAVAESVVAALAWTD
jgi:transketolase